jgi:hypothetical protein
MSQTPVLGTAVGTTVGALDKRSKEGRRPSSWGQCGDTL